MIQTTSEDNDIDVDVVHSQSVIHGDLTGVCGSASGVFLHSYLNAG